MGREAKSRMEARELDRASSNVSARRKPNQAKMESCKEQLSRSIFKTAIVLRLLKKSDKAKGLCNFGIGLDEIVAISTPHMLRSEADRMMPARHCGAAAANPDFEIRQITAANLKTLLLEAKHAPHMTDCVRKGSQRRCVTCRGLERMAVEWMALWLQCLDAHWLGTGSDCDQRSVGNSRWHHSSKLRRLMARVH